jgi:type II secretion system protein J
VRAPRRRSGFTLLEVVVALGIMTLIGAMAWGTLMGTLQTRDYLEADDQVARGARNTLDRLQRQLSVAFLTTNTGAVNTYRTVFVAVDEDEQDTLFFATLAHRRLFQDAREGDQAELTWFVDDDPDDKGRQMLLARESARIDQEPALGGRVLPMARGVTRFDLRFLDGTTGEWRDDWDTNGTETPARLPRAVTVILGLAAPDPDGEDEDREQLFVETILLELSTPMSRSLFAKGQN